MEHFHCWHLEPFPKCYVSLHSEKGVTPFLEFMDIAETDYIFLL